MTTEGNMTGPEHYRKAEQLAEYPLARCTFYLRTPAGDTQARYRMIAVRDVPPDQAPSLVTVHVPAQGDLIWLKDDGASRRMYRVIGREWNHPVYGSRSWPFDTTAPHDGPMVQIVVELAEGLFADEATEDNELRGG